MDSADKDVVIELDIGYWPEAAVSGAVLVATEYSKFLTFNARKLGKDGFYHDAGTALIEFVYCSIVKFGYPNDEALPGHPLYSKMEGAYSMYEVLNSSWIDEIRRQNRIPFPDTRPSTPNTSRHFIISFHDSTFEGIARDFKLEVTEEPYHVTWAKISERVTKE